MHASRKLAVAAASVVMIGLSSPAQAQVQFDWAVILDLDNACETGPHGCLGSVSEEYWITDTEVTNAQYAVFLNAVAATDTFGLYNIQMTDDVTHGGIERQGTILHTYSAKTGMESRPVSYVSYWDALRFANWLHNDQPTGVQAATTTEDGAYTLTSEAIAANNVVRNEEALFGIPDDDEWYKAAYYDFAGGYFLYPTSSNSAPACTLPTSDPDTANCGFVGHATDVGSYPGSASPSGTLDQGANLREWTGAIVGAARTLRGGAYNTGSAPLASTARWALAPTSEASVLGFRVALVGIEPLPVPALGTVATGVLLVFG